MWIFLFVSSISQIIRSNNCKCSMTNDSFVSWCISVGFVRWHSTFGMMCCEHFAHRPCQKQNKWLAFFPSRPEQIRNGTVEKIPWYTSIPYLTFSFRIVHFLWEITYYAYDTDLETSVFRVVLLVSYEANDSWGYNRAFVIYSWWRATSNMARMSLYINTQRGTAEA